MILFRLFFLCFLATTSLAEENSKPRLVVYTHELYIQDWMQVGNPIKKAFESGCNCKIEFITFSNSSSIISRLVLEGESTRADIVLGLSSYILDKAEDTKLFAEINFKPQLDLPIEWKNKYFLPFEYSYLTLVYNSKKIKYPPPSSLEELINSDLNYQVVIQDPRTSSTGLAAVLWIKEIYGDRSSEIWQKLKKKIHLISRTWGESYSLFAYGQGDLVITNSTSPVYHMLVENNYDYKALKFPEGHVLGFSTMGMLKSSKNKELGEKFMKYVLSKNFQRLIPVNHFMNPAIDIDDEMPKEYNNIPKFDKTYFVDSDTLRKNRDSWIKEWLVVMLSKTK